MLLSLICTITSSQISSIKVFVLDPPLLMLALLLVAGVDGQLVDAAPPARNASRVCGGADDMHA
jgi:hypothetical protein